VHLKAQITRELDRLEVLLEQLKNVEAERDALLKPVSNGGSLASLRQFDNRRQVAAYAAWLWLQNQRLPRSTCGSTSGSSALADETRKTIIVALARKLLIALWRYTTAGVAIEGRRRRRHRRRSDLIRTDLIQSWRIPGGRTEMTVGLNNRPKEGSRPPEPTRRKRDVVAAATRRRPYLSLI
jgi:hypothetical protein